LYLIEQTPFSVALIPHVTSPANNDADVLNKLFESRKERAGNRLLILPDTLTAPQYKGYIARLRFLTAARTHASIAAYSSGVPTLVLGYSVKSKGIARDIFGDESSVIQAENIRRLEDITTPFNSMLKTEAQIREVTAQKNPQLTAAAFEAGKKITEILNNG
jgi:polysaccharide pyruvyl transferase WcaK-like protein